MVGPRSYDLMYRFGAPWDGGARDDLVDLVTSGRLTADALPRAIDLGCGTGGNVRFLAEQGFDTVGVDFSPLALRLANQRSAGTTPAPRYVRGDLTAPSIEGVEGPFDLLVDYGTLDDLKGDRRLAMRDTILQLSRPGSAFLMFCFYGERSVLPVFTFDGPSKIAAGLAHGEERELFGADFEIETLSAVAPGTHGFGLFLMTRRSKYRPDAALIGPSVGLGPG